MPRTGHCGCAFVVTDLSPIPSGSGRDSEHPFSNAGYEEAFYDFYQTVDRGGAELLIRCNNGSPIRIAYGIKGKRGFGKLMTPHHRSEQRLAGLPHRGRR